MTPTALLVGVIDVGFFVCLTLTWLFLWRRGINGPCQLTLGLLGIAHLAELVRRWPQGVLPADPWTWLCQIAFGFVFLYMIVHIGWLIEAARGRAACLPRPFQPWVDVQLASRPGQPRPHQ